MNPYRAVQGLLRVKDRRILGILGSCFRVHSRQHFLTARHCVESVDPSEVAILNVVEENSDLRCLSISRHPTADIAMIETRDAVPVEYEQFVLTDWSRAYGAPIHCFGMVAGSERDFQNLTQRIIGGIVQRDYVHAEGIYQYPALELSVPIPMGMSGGPAFYEHKPTQVIGLVTGCVTSEIVVSRVEEVVNGDSVVRERVSEITRYGVAVWLEHVKDWIHSVIGPPA